MNISDFEKGLEQTWYCDFLKSEIDILIEIGRDETLSDFEPILNNIMNWDESFFKKLEPMLYAYCDETLALSGEDYPCIQTQSDVWRFVNIGALTLHSHDYQYYVLASGGCEWEQEHGLEFDVDESNRVLYLGSFISNGFHENPDKPSTYNFVKGIA